MPLSTRFVSLRITPAAFRMREPPNFGSVEPVGLRNVTTERHARADLGSCGKPRRN